jgi:hypothetical protein
LMGGKRGAILARAGHDAVFSNNSSGAEELATKVPRDPVRTGSAPI